MSNSNFTREEMISSACMYEYGRVAPVCSLYLQHASSHSGGQAKPALPCGAYQTDEKSATRHWLRSLRHTRIQTPTTTTHRRGRGRTTVDSSVLVLEWPPV